MREFTKEVLSACASRGPRYFIVKQLLETLG